MKRTGNRITKCIMTFALIVAMLLGSVPLPGISYAVNAAEINDPAEHYETTGEEATDLFEENAESENAESENEKSDDEATSSVVDTADNTKPDNAPADNINADDVTVIDTDVDNAADGEDVQEPDQEVDDKEQQDDCDYEDAPAFEQSKSIDGVKVSVTADEGVFPEVATLSVEKVTVEQEKQAEEAVEDERPADQNVAVSYTYDIKVLDKDGNEIEPADSSKVKVSFKLEEVADDNLTTNVYHITEDTEDAGSGELVAEKLPVETDGDTATAETDGFSLYTVEFTYNDLQYVLPGDSEVELSEILSAVGLSGEVTEVSVSDSSLFSVAKNDNGQWIVTAHKAFSTEEWMKVTINSTEYEIKVTDDSQQIATGTCGTGVTWMVYENGLLAITGSGAMDDINGAGNQPWVSYGSQITSISIGSGVTKIGNSAFSQLDSVTTATFENGSTCSSIGDQAFYDCDALTSIAIPASVTSIGANAFDGCSVLSTVTFDGISACSSIGAHAFCETGLTSVSIPDSVTSMGKYTFYRCLSLATVTIGNGLEVIPDHAFAQCRALTTLQIGNHVTTIDKYAFSRCEVLPSVQLPNSLTSIKEGTFQSCAALATVTIPAGVTSITEFAFTYCTNLNRVIMLGNTPPDLLDDNGIPISSSNKQWMPFFSYSGDQAYKFNGEICVPAGSEDAYANNTSWVGYASKVAPRRSVTLNVNNNGTISSDQIYTIDSAKYATVGKTVTINGTPDSGFALTDLTVTKLDSTIVDVSGTGNTRTFTMPDDSVTINAVFNAPLAASDITVENLTYNGSDQNVTVKRGTTTLTLNTDYTVVYKQNDVAVTPHDAGEYTAVITGAGDFGGTVNKTFTISKVPLTVTAKPKTITYGDAPANDGVTYSGFVGGENADVLSGTLGYTYNYSQYGNVGSYTITPGGLTSNNYDITFSSGTLTVNPKEVGLTWGNSTFTYDGLSHVPSCTATGMVNSDAVTVTVSGAKTNASNSDYTATAVALAGSKAGNYQLPAVKTKSFWINRADAVITIAAGKDSYNEKYGNSSFALNGISTNVGNSALEYAVTAGNDVVSISSSGIVTILKPGTATITVSVPGTDNYNAAVSQTVTVTVSNGDAPKKKPSSTISVVYSVDKVSAVSLPAGWTWSAADKDKALTAGGSVTVTAEYTAADKDYYNGGITATVTITRQEKPADSSPSSNDSDNNNQSDNTNTQPIPVISSPVTPTEPVIPVIPLPDNPAPSVPNIKPVADDVTPEPGKPFVDEEPMDGSVVQSDVLADESDAAVQVTGTQDSGTDDGIMENPTEKDVWNPWWTIVICGVIIAIGFGGFYVIRKKRES